MRVQYVVNRLLFGERDDPYGVLTRLGRRIEASVSHDELLPEVVRATAEALRLPYEALFFAWWRRKRACRHVWRRGARCA